MLEDWGLDDSRSWRPGYLSPGKRAWEIQASARGKGRRSGGRSAGKGGKGELAREIEGGSTWGRSRRARAPSADAVAGESGGDLGERAPSARGGGGAWDPGAGRSTLVVSSQRGFRSF